MKRCEQCRCPDRTWVRVKEVAAALDLSSRSVYKYVQKGMVEGCKVTPGSPWLIRHSSVHGLLGLSRQELNAARD